MWTGCPVAGPGKGACIGMACGAWQHGMSHVQHRNLNNLHTAAPLARQTAVRASSGDEAPAGLHLPSQTCALAGTCCWRHMDCQHPDLTVWT
jgi:hypothetical protein